MPCAYIPVMGETYYHREEHHRKQPTREEKRNERECPKCGGMMSAPGLGQCWYCLMKELRERERPSCISNVISVLEEGRILEFDKDLEV
jgi:hypothetical protein